MSFKPERDYNKQEIDWNMGRRPAGPLFKGLSAFVQIALIFFMLRVFMVYTDNTMGEIPGLDMFIVEFIEVAKETLGGIVR